MSTTEGAISRGLSVQGTQVHRTPYERAFGLPTVDLVLLQIREYPRLTDEQALSLISHHRTGHTIDDVRGDTDFVQSIVFENRDKFRRVLEVSASPKDILVNCHLRLIASIAKKHVQPWAPFEDLVQEGTMGLMEGLRRFEADKDTAFASYAYYWIRKGVQNAVTNYALIRLPLHVRRDLIKLEKLRERLHELNGEEPSSAQIQDCAVEEGWHHKPSLIVKASVLSSVLLSGQLGEGINSLDDLVSSSDDVPTEAQTREYLGRIQDWMDRNLNPRQKLVLVARLGLDGFKSEGQEEVGKRLGVTRQRVQQIEKAIMEKLVTDSVFIRSL